MFDRIIDAIARRVIERLPAPVPGPAGDFVTHERGYGPGDGPSKVITEPTTGVIPNTQQRERLADAAAFTERGTIQQRTVWRNPKVVKPVREPIIVDPTNEDDLVAAMRR